MIDNTTASGAFSHLAEMMTSGRSDYVEKMEADGQRQLVESDLMPADGPWSELAELGFSQGAPVEGDDLFCHATQPAGWTREASETSTWSYILDTAGVRRVGLFYKAAFYDRRAQCASSRPLTSPTMAARSGC
jgi:hypothetical protein